MRSNGRCEVKMRVSSKYLLTIKTINLCHGQLNQRVNRLYDFCVGAVGDREGLDGGNRGARVDAEDGLEVDSEFLFAIRKTDEGRKKPCTEGPGDEEFVEIAWNEIEFHVT